MHYAIIDIETTGGSPKDSKITEIAIYKHNGKEIIDSYESLVNPEMPIPPFIIKLTGISNKMVEDAPKFFEIAKKIIEFTEDCVFVAHNVGFDYGILRMEFRHLGYDYRKSHLCTVRASRDILPGHDSYSLGKLTRSLGIELIGRHRAGGDAFATAKLFSMLIEKSPTNLATFLQEDINTNVLNTNLDLDTLEEIPNKTGVYKFYNEFNQLIYIGKSKHIKKRVDQHLKNTKTKKGLQLIQEITRIDFTLTGSELIALLQESELIKVHQPVHNQALKKNSFPYGLFQYQDEQGYIRFFVGLISKTESTPLASFTTKLEAVSQLTALGEQYELCQKLCGLYNTDSACFHYDLKQCKGACIGKESVDAYNTKCQKLINELTLNSENFYLIENGRTKSERSLIYIEQGSIVGYGYAPFNFHKSPKLKWARFIDRIEYNRDVHTILKMYLRKNNEIRKHIL
jgi:DNA polymerase-3 subunit epsilon